MARAVLGLGSNLGDREENLRAALRMLNGFAGTVLRVSPVYETEPIGETPEPVPPYLNCVACLETDLPPLDLLDYTQATERAGGRIPTYRWGPRTIDIDILFYGTVALSLDRLTIPHPRLFERAFVLVPLADLFPGLTFADGTNIAQRLADPAIRSQRIHPWPLRAPLLTRE